MKFLTFLNSGCIEICKNMLKSAENVGINMNDFYIACLDSNAYENLKEYKNAYLHIDQPITEYQDWTFSEESGFRNIVKNKWSIIKKIYQENKELCWVDTDIVFIENPIEYISGHEEILFQGDSPGSTLCSGFMVFNGSKECEEIINECASAIDADDQLIINEIMINKYPNNAAILNRDLFPNGYAYYTEGKKENALIVHNNFMVGVETKMQKFKEEKLWFL
jgi:hypothetical protein